MWILIALVLIALDVLAFYFLVEWLTGRNVSWGRSLYMVFIAAMCLSGIARFLHPYIGWHWGLLISAAIGFLWLSNEIVERTETTWKRAMIIFVSFYAIHATYCVLAYFVVLSLEGYGVAQN